MTFVLTLILATLAVGAAVYWFAPAALYELMMRGMRRLAGLTLREVEIDGHVVPYLEGGHGEPLLLLHGFAANKDHWTLAARQLAPHFRVFAPDLPGFGDSTRKPEARYGLEEQLARIEAFAAAVGLGRFHLGGNSMGGYLAAMYAARHPEQVASLWLLAPAGARSAQESEMLRLLAAGDNPLLVTDLASFRRLTALCFHQAPPLPPRFELPLYERARAEGPFNAKIFDEMFTDPKAFEDMPGGFATRALIVWGDDDRVLHPSGLDILHGLFSDAECILMPRMGHVPMVERPADTVADLLRFHGRRARP